MARKKADSIPQEDPEITAESTEERASDAAVEADGATFAAEPGDPFPMLDGESSLSAESEGEAAGVSLPEPDSTIYMPHDAADHDLFPPEEASDGATPPEMFEDGSNGEASENYGTLLNELSGNAPERAMLEEAPLILPESDAGNGDGNGDELSAGDRMLLEEDGELPVSEAENTLRPSVSASRVAQPRRDERVLTINAREEIETEAEREATRWHEIQNSYRTRRILTGTLDTLEQTESGLTLAVVNYNGFRIAIPLKEMGMYAGELPSGREYMELMDMLARRLNARLGSEIDFIVKGYDNASRSVVASRRDAMYRKRQTFYMDTDALGQSLIYKGRVVQARVVAVAEKVIRVEVFGVECTIRASGLSWTWIGNARDQYHVGDRVLVRVQQIIRPSVERLRIEADIRSVSSATNIDNLRKCVLHGRYVGRVTDYREGRTYLRLSNGANAQAHTCYDFRTPGKKDDVSFMVTRLDMERGVAIGIITRIIRQNL